MSTVPEPKKFFLEVPPYASFEIGPKGFLDVMRVQFFRGPLDAYCVDCGKDSVFWSASPGLRLALPGPRTSSAGDTPPVGVEDLKDDINTRIIWPYSLLFEKGPVGPQTLSGLQPLALAERAFQVKFDCTRCPDHSLYFFFQVCKGSISKVGQAPSLADLHLNDVKKYRKVLGEDKHREFTKGIGLNAHGVGIGAFVYLRRIFEDLIKAAAQEAAKVLGWDETGYARSRMDERIRLLSGRLPTFLVENRAMYSILSSGIHELSEQQCLAIFSPLRVGIELILDEILERQEKAAKIARAAESLSKIKSTLGDRESAS